jgi:NAD(P)-dependent dehydrogenase (short-subunit alcohol dehydrogenase family)
MALRFDGRVAIVTGAGGGLGRDYAQALAARGAKVVVNDIGTAPSDKGTSAAAQLVVEAITARGGIAVANLDSVASPPGITRLIEAAMDHYGRIDILVNNAGIARHKPFEDQTLGELRDILATHLEGGYLAAQAAFPYMREAGYGRVLFTSSSAAAFGMPWASAYAAAKGGLLGLMKVLSLEGLSHGVLCNALLPGAFTGMAARPNDSTPLVFQEMYRACARIERRFTPEFVTPLVVYLVSEKCISTGEIYSAQGGHYARAVLALGDGWTSPRDEPPSDEDIETHFAKIRDCANYRVPADAIADLNFTGDAVAALGNAIR